MELRLLFTFYYIDLGFLVRCIADISGCVLFVPAPAPGSSYPAVVLLSLFLFLAHAVWLTSTQIQDLCRIKLLLCVLRYCLCLLLHMRPPTLL